MLHLFNSKMSGNAVGSAEKLLKKSEWKKQREEITESLLLEEVANSTFIIVSRSVELHLGGSS